MAEKKEYKYYAFISYSHKDKKCANWLYRKLCSYRLPRIVKKSDKNLPNKLTPLFLDEYHLQAGKIKDNINTELDSAKNLIVICSPNITVANSDGINWIDYEVEYFANSGKENNIIPVMVDGDKSISFSPTLKKLDVLAQDVSKFSRDRIISNVVAGLLGLDPDVLWRDEKRRIIRRRWINGCFALLGMSILSLISLFYWDYNRTYIECYSDYVDKFGIPSGIALLDDATVSKRYSHYRFVYRGRYGLVGKRILREVVHANSVGLPIPQKIPIVQHRHPIQRFYYHEKGGNKWLINTIVYYTENEEEICRCRVVDSDRNPDNTVFEYNDRFRAVENTPLKVGCWRDGFDRDKIFISYPEKKDRVFRDKYFDRILIERNRAGFPVVIKYYKSLGAYAVPCVNTDGIFIVSNQYDSVGRLIKADYCGNDKASYSYVTSYDSNGLLKQITYDKCQRKYDEIRYNQDGNMICLKSIEEDDHTVPTFKLDRSYHFDYSNEGVCNKVDFKANDNLIGGVLFDYDKASLLLKRSIYYGSDGEPILYGVNSAVGYEYHRDVEGIVRPYKIFFSWDDYLKNPYLKKMVDSNNQVIKQLWCDKDGNLKENSKGYAGWSRSYTLWGEGVLSGIKNEKIEYFDSKNKPASTMPVVHRSYDVQGRPLVVTFTDLDAHPRPYLWGCVGMNYIWENNVLKECRYKYQNVTGQSVTNLFEGWRPLYDDDYMNETNRVYLVKDIDGTVYEVFSLMRDASLSFRNNCDIVACCNYNGHHIQFEGILGFFKTEDFCYPIGWLADHVNNRSVEFNEDGVVIDDLLVEPKINVESNIVGYLSDGSFINIGRDEKKLALNSRVDDKGREIECMYISVSTLMSGGEKKKFIKGEDGTYGYIVVYGENESLRTYIDQDRRMMENKSGEAMVLLCEEDSDIPNAKIIFDKNKNGVAEVHIFEEILKDGQADKAGIRKGDILMSINDELVMMDSNWNFGKRSKGPSILYIARKENDRWLKYSVKINEGMVGVKLGKSRIKLSEDVFPKNIRFRVYNKFEKLLQNAKPVERKGE